MEVIYYYNDLYKGLCLYLSSMPCYGVALIVELLAAFLFFGVACYLALSAKNRKLAERAQELNNKLKNWVMKNQNLNEKVIRTLINYSIVSFSNLYLTAEIG